MSTSYRSREPMSVEQAIERAAAIGWARDTAAEQRNDAERAQRGALSPTGHICLSNTNGSGSLWVYGTTTGTDGKEYLEAEVFSGGRSGIEEIEDELDLVSENEDEYWEIFPEDDDEDDPWDDPAAGSRESGPREVRDDDREDFHSDGFDGYVRDEPED